MKYVTKKEVDWTGIVAIIWSSIVMFFSFLVIIIYTVVDINISMVLYAPVMIPLTISLVSLMWATIYFINHKKVAYLYINQSFDFKTMTERDINDRIDLWHTLDRDTGKLREFLGMKKEEYKEFVERPNEFYEKYNILKND